MNLLKMVKNKQMEILIFLILTYCINLNNFFYQNNLNNQNYNNQNNLNNQNYNNQNN